ncbi:MAG: alginate lyase family protein [Gammaproteobacteria bacterium]|nr:alginate lyase family protein [Gammaproteobacteria bacterium]
MKAKSIMRLFGKTLWAALLVNIFLAGSMTTAIAHEQHPNILLNAQEIITIKAKISVSEEGEVTGEEPWRSAYEKMIEQGEAALKLPMMSVTFGGRNSGDENCANIRIFCNGRFYDDDRDGYDSDNGSWPIGAGVRDLGMAYAFTGDAKYAIHLIKLVKVWAIDPTTGMLPQFSNNQSRISLMPSMSGLIYGVDLAWNYPGWDQADKDAFKDWVLTFGRNAVYAFGQAETNASDNNFENWRNAFLSVAGAFTGDQALLATAYRNFRRAITWQVDCTGLMNQEYSRVKGWAGRGYSLYAMHAMTITAEAARHQGVDLYNYTTKVQYQDWTQDQQKSQCGVARGLKVALDYHAPFLSGAAPWPNSIISGNPLNASHGMGIYELAYSVWEEDQYLAVVNKWGRPLGTNNWPLGVVTLTHANRYPLTFTFTPTAPSVVRQPEPVTVTEGEDANFSVVASGSGSLVYQWYRGNSPVGANSSSYTVVDVSESDNGVAYSCRITNSEGSVNSSEVVLTVSLDSTAPTLTSALALSDTRVDILFSEAVNANSAENSANYEVDLGVAVTSATLNGNGRTVSLAVSQLTEDTTYTVQVSNVQDLAQTPNTIAAQSSRSFTYRTADGFEDGTADGWSGLVASNWSVEVDEGDMAYYLNTTDFDSPGGGRLGEYSLLPTEYGDFTFAVRAKLGDDVVDNATADYAMVFGFQDSDNYYYMLFNNDQNYTQLFKVINGSRTLLETANSADWLNDNAYHSIEVKRIGSDISVRFDGNVILNASDGSLGAGKIGVGSYNDSAYFDDVNVTSAVSGGGSSGGGSTGGGSTGGGSTGGGSTGGGSTGGGSTGGGSTGGGSAGGGSTGGGSTGGGSTGGGSTGGGSTGGGSVNGDTEGGGAFNPLFAGLMLLLMGVRGLRRKIPLVVSTQV